MKGTRKGIEGSRIKILEVWQWLEVSKSKIDLNIVPTSSAAVFADVEGFFMCSLLLVGAVGV